MVIKKAPRFAQGHKVDLFLSIGAWKMMSTYGATQCMPETTTTTGACKQGKTLTNKMAKRRVC